jgi:putative nucleotidyltransferase with HDIG domain
MPVEQATAVGEKISMHGAIQVPVRTLADSCPDFDLYVRRGESQELVLYRERTQPIQEDDVAKLEKRGIRTLFVASSDHDNLRRHVEEQIQNGSDTPLSDRYKVFIDVQRAVFDAVFHEGSTDEVLTFADSFSDNLATMVCDSDAMLSELFRLMRHDDGTYTHSVNVCTYTLLLAEGVGINSQEELAAVARGALLHDLGKRHIDLKVLNKPDKLTDDERKIIEEHPRLGFEELCLRDDMPWDQLMMIYQHHERIDGQGYPVGLTRDEIHVWAKLCAIADIFHALTSHRPYRKPMSVEEGCAFLESVSDKAVDGEMVKCWTSLAKQPSNLTS